MTVVKHPTIPGYEKTVPDGDVAKWEKAGWVPPEKDAAPAPAAPSATRKRSAKKTPRATT